ncbi:hypothetical protein Vretifemale_16706, partial [Volvox reticuliferus]
DTLSSSDELVKLALPLRITARQQRHGLAAASGSINGPNKVAAATLRGLPPPVLLSPPRIQPPASRITQPAGAATTTTLQWEVVRAADRLSLQAVPPSPSKLVSAVDITALPSASPLLPAPPRAFRRLPHRHASFADIMHRLRREDRQPPPAVLVKEGGPAAVAAAATTAAAAADKRRTFFNRGLRPNNFLDDPKSSEVSVDIPAATAAASAGAPRTKRSMSITGALAHLISSQANNEAAGKGANARSPVNSGSGKDACPASGGFRSNGLAAALSYLRPKISRIRSEMARGPIPSRGSKGSVELLHLVDPAAEDRDSASVVSVPPSFVPVD